MIKNEPYADYHARRKTHLTAHSLIDFIKCPLKYRINKDRSFKSTAMDFGSAYHCQVLEPQIFATEYEIIDAPVNPKTDKPYRSDSKKYKDAFAGIDGNIVSSSDHELITDMSCMLFQNEYAKELLNNAEVEQSFVTSIHGVAIQSRVDAVRIDGDVFITDLKTCLSLDNFAYDTKKYCYDIQMEVYRNVLKTEYPDLDIKTYIVACEKERPNRCGVFELPEKIDLAMFIDSKIKEYSEALESNVWIPKYNDIQILNISRKLF